jgi:methyl-accepting chemotaxis protein
MVKQQEKKEQKENLKIRKRSDRRKKLAQTQHRTRSQNRVWNKISGIRAKLLIAILIPTLFMALFGIVSYKKSSGAIISNYVNLTSDTVNAVKEYIIMGIDEVEKKSYELTDNDSVKDYYNNFSNMNEQDAETALNSLKSQISSVKSAHSFIYAVHTIGKDGNSVASSDTLSANTRAAALGFCRCPRCPDRSFGQLRSKAHTSR